jgi:hypothetical protein
MDTEESVQIQNIQEDNLIMQEDQNDWAVSRGDGSEATSLKSNAGSYTTDWNPADEISQDGIDVIWDEGPTDAITASKDGNYTNIEWDLVDEIGMFFFFKLLFQYHVIQLDLLHRQVFKLLLRLV